MINNKIVLPTLSTLIIHAVELTEKNNLTTKNKKAFALDVIKTLIDKLPTGDNKNFLIDAYQNNNIGDMIDVVIMASKGNLQLNKITPRSIINKLLKCILSIIKNDKKSRHFK